MPRGERGGIVIDLSERASERCRAIHRDDLEWYRQFARAQMELIRPAQVRSGHRWVLRERFGSRDGEGHLCTQWIEEPIP
jgi:hypothetical protein